LPVFDHHFKEADFALNDLHRQWALAITTLLADAAKMDFYKQQSLKRARDFSVEKSSKKWLDILEAGVK
jgi:glycosyltransferase involved in cell wall biosynthesis